MGLVLLIVCNIGAILGDQHYRLELLTHFRFLYLLLAFVAAIILLPLKQWVWGGISVIIVSINLIMVIPFYNQPNAPKGIQVGVLKILDANVYTDNKDIKLLMKAIDQNKPDVIGLQEINQRWMDGLQELTKRRYPYYRFVPRDDNFGIALLSRYPLKNLKTIDFGGGVPSISANLVFKELSVHLLVTHPMPPISQEYARKRNWQFKELGNNLKEHKNVIAMGDFNATPWSPQFRELLITGGVYHARRGYGVQGSWPEILPICRIPIDHILVSGNIKTKSHTILPTIGSDHLPILGEFEVIQ